MRKRGVRVPRWHARFLHALRTCGNVQIACDRALVHHSYVYRYRKKNAEFAEAWDDARRHAALAMAAHDGSAEAAYADADGARLVVTSGVSGAPQRMERARPYRWTRADELRFLDVLASTCNVTLACEAAGHNSGSAYARRSHWPAFREE